MGKLTREIQVAAKLGGPNPEFNARLAAAITNAKKQSVTRDTIERAIAKGSGTGAGAVQYHTVVYEGFAPHQVPVIVECLTDNRNRAAMEVRTATSRNGGSLADPGSVAYLFNRKGVVVLPKEQEGRDVSEDDVLEATLDAGAEEVNDLGESFEVVCDATDLVTVRRAVTDSGLDYDSADVSWLPSVSVALDDDAAAKVLRLVDALEDCDDVQNVWANFDISDDVLERLEG